MNFELADELNELLTAGKLEDAIQLTESKLSQEPPTDFKSILGKNLVHLADPLASYIDTFFKRAKGKLKIKALYCEMNGFTINNDLWFLTMFAYESYEGLDDLDWLSDWQDDSGSQGQFAITGYENLQKVYDDYMNAEKWRDATLKSSANICELLVILRLQELLKEAVKKGKEKKMEWTSVPVLVTAHDYDLIYKAS